MNELPPQGAPRSSGTFQASWLLLLGLSGVAQFGPRLQVHVLRRLGAARRTGEAGHAGVRHRRRSLPKRALVVRFFAFSRFHWKLYLDDAPLEGTIFRSLYAHLSASAAIAHGTAC